MSECICEQSIERMIEMEEPQKELPTALNVRVVVLEQIDLLRQAAQRTDNPRELIEINREIVSLIKLVSLR